MKLYYSPGSCSLSPHIVLSEAGIDAELIKVDFRTRETEHGDAYSAINPKGYVPALELDDGELLTEGPAIVQYLADLKPEAGLVPEAGSPDRYRAQEWLNFVASELHKKFGPLVVPGAAEAAKEQAIMNIGRRLDFAAKYLEDHDYLVGEKFSIADIYLYVILRWVAAFKLDIADAASLQEYKARIEDRPAVVQTLKDEGLLK